MKDRIDTSFDLVLNRHVSIHLGLLDSIQVLVGIRVSPDAVYQAGLSGKPCRIFGFFLPDSRISSFFLPDNRISGPSLLQTQLHTLWLINPAAIMFNYIHKQRERGLELDGKESFSTFLSALIVPFHEMNRTGKGNIFEIGYRSYRLGLQGFRGRGNFSRGQIIERGELTPNWL